jgi:aminoglycoside phosphotransferase (APT) family kinase protein
MVDGVPLGSGRDADVYAIDERRVLRRYRRGGDVTAEAAVMTYLAAAGFPAPVVYGADGPDLVLERLAGPTMLSALAVGELGIEEGATILADLHRRLHEVPARISGDPGVRILHLDLHPDNVMLTGRGPVVIDWRNTAEGPPALDVALTSVILAQVAVDETHDLAPAAAVMLTAFLRRAGGDPVSMLDEAVARRGADPALTAAEVDRLPAVARLIVASR